MIRFEIALRALFVIFVSGGLPATSAQDLGKSRPDSYEESWKSAAHDWSQARTLFRNGGDQRAARKLRSSALRRLRMLVRRHPLRFGAHISLIVIFTQEMGDQNSVLMSLPGELRKSIDAGNRRRCRLLWSRFNSLRLEILARFREVSRLVDAAAKLRPARKQHLAEWHALAALRVLYAQPQFQARAITIHRYAISIATSPKYAKGIRRGLAWVQGRKPCKWCFDKAGLLRAYADLERLVRSRCQP